jgi:hypothetical protein
MRRFYSAIGALVLLSTSLPACAASGEIVANVYHNKFVGLRFPVPRGWHVGTDADVKQGIKEGAQIVGLDGAMTRATIRQMPGKVLLLISQQPLDSDVSGVNRNIIVFAIDLRGHREEISSGADYLRIVADGLRKQLPDATISEVTKRRFGGEEFHRLDARLRVAGVSAYQSQLARIANDYLIAMNLTAESSTGLEELCSLADTMAFSPVSPEIDTSAEGQSFRRLAGFRAPSSSGNPLKTIGVILIVGGAILMLRNLSQRRPNQ